MAVLFSNSYKDLSYWFSETAIDNDGEVVSDINAGITKLLPELIEQLNNEANAEKRFVIPDCQIAMPDVAAKTFYNNENMWWYVCLENNIVSPFNEYLNNLLFFIFSQSILTQHDLNTKNKETEKESKIGKIIELN